MTKRNLLSLFILLMLALGGCIAPPNSAQKEVSSPTGTASTYMPSTAPVEQTVNLLYTPTVSPIPTVALSRTPEPPVVIVSAVKGNVFIRRGPDLAYNPVSVLMDGQSARALGRDVLSKWLQIPIPDHPGETGWISIQTHFIAVSGEVRNLPESTPPGWPVLASLRNCTYHFMKAEPGGIIIPAVNNFSENVVQINPGVYTIHDIEVDGSPGVMEIEIKEGSEVDILDDGNGEHKKCVP